VGYIIGIASGRQLAVDGTNFELQLVKLPPGAQGQAPDLSVGLGFGAMV